MAMFWSRTFRVVTLTAALGMSLVAIGPQPAKAVEVGDPAPGFSLASTTGADISLDDFRGKKWVLLEFYASDFAPA
jgi:hypothetical protein